MRKNNYIEAYKKKDEEYDGFIHYLDEAERLADQFYTGATVDNEGIVRWNSNDSIPPKDILEFWDYLDYDFNVKKSTEVKDKETSEFLQKYREQMKNHQPSQEELFEMRAEFGEGADVVNVVTGKVTKL